LGLTNAEKQARWRERRQQHITELERRIRDLERQLRNRADPEEFRATTTKQDAATTDDGREVRKLQRQLSVLQGSFEDQARAEVLKRINEMSLPAYAEEWRQTREFLERRNGHMSRVVFRKILACLHPDSRKSATEERLNEAVVSDPRREN
jgi:hypothetical protein